MYHVYVIQTSSGISKVGISSNAYRRVSETQVDNHEELRLLSVIVTDSESSAKELESHLHILLEPYWLRGEWFNIPELILQSLVAILATNAIKVEFPQPVLRTYQKSKPHSRSAAKDMVTAYLIEYPESIDLSVRELAEIIGVGKDSVAKAKKELQK